MLRAGTSVVTITPPLGTPLAGDIVAGRTATTVADDLTARALVLDDGATRLALVVCDLIGITAGTTAAARAAIEERAGIPAAHVMIACTHTHSGPSPRPTAPEAGQGGPAWAGETAADDGYLAGVAARIAEGVAVACSRLAPAQVAYGAADTQGICFNRRIRMRDGRVTMNFLLSGSGEGASPDVVGAAGPVDPQVTALLVEDPDRTARALWASLSTHHVGVADPLAISADYFGQYARAAARLLGERCIGLMANGTSGNVNNIDLWRTLQTPDNTERGRLVGTAVAGAAVAATITQPRHAAPVLAAERRPFVVRRRAVPEADLAAARDILARPEEEELAPSNAFSFAVADPIPPRWVRAYAREAPRVAAMPEEVTTELQVLRIGDLAIVALPGEIFVEFGMAIKAASPFPYTAVVGLANDNIGYVPTAEAFAEGGYETWTIRSSWAAPGTGEAMVEAALAGLRRLAERPPA